MDILNRLTGIPLHDIAFNRVPLMRPKGGQASTTFMRLCDAFEEAILSGQKSDGHSGMELPTSPKDLKQDGRVATPVYVPETEASVIECYRKLPLRMEHVMEVFDFFASAISQARQIRQRGGVELFLSTMEGFNDFVTSSTYYKRLMANSMEHNDLIGAIKDGPDPTLQGGSPRTGGQIAMVSGATDAVMQVFRMLDAVEECMDNFRCRLSKPTHPLPASTSSSPAPLDFSNELFSVSDINKLVESCGVSCRKDVTRGTQGEERYLRSSARRLALSLQSTAESSLQDPLLQSTFALTLSHLYELSHDRNHLDAAAKATWQAVTALPNPRSGLSPISVLLIRTCIYSQRLLSRETGRVEFLDRAVVLGAATLRISSECCPGYFAGRPLLSMELAECLFDRYHHLGDVKDLDDALSYGSAACKEEGCEDDQHSRYILHQENPQM